MSWNSHAGYDDGTESHYSYDSDVANSRRVQVGDLVVVKGSTFVIGIAQIEEIVQGRRTKELLRCPQCSGRPESRKTKSLRWKCTSCKYEFSDDELQHKKYDVQTYTARYGNTWQDANGVLRNSDVFSFQKNGDKQGSIREIDVNQVEKLLQIIVGNPEDAASNLSLVPDLIVGGHGISIVRRRRGQQEFRLALLAERGNSCAISGPNPSVVLEAAHLKQFAKHETHVLSEGLLLRRDLHALFDRHLLRIDSSRCLADVAPTIRNFESYAALHGRKLDSSIFGSIDTTLIDLHFDESEPNFAA